MMPQKYLYIRDSFQNILGIADINGKIVVKYKYDAWGTTSIKEDISSSGIGDLNPFRYKGYYYDKESKMYYCKTRYYIPLWGRWLNGDSPFNLSYNKINDVNLYCYCGNDPILGYDKNGKFWFTFLSTVIGGLIGGISSIVSQICSGDEPSWEAFASGFVGGAVSGFIIGITKGACVGLANYASAAAESFTGEMIEYATGRKDLTGDNVMASIVNIVKDTAINGTINCVADRIGGKLYPNLKTNKGWFVPKKFISFFTKSYGQKVIAGNLVGGIISTGFTLLKDKIEDIVEEFKDYVENRDPVKIFS